jgi:hypothetical protein
MYIVVLRRFLMPGLVTECCRYLKQKLCPENCLGMAAFARSYFRPGLTKVAMTYAHNHFSEVVSSSVEFLDLDVSKGPQPFTHMPRH